MKKTHKNFVKKNLGQTLIETLAAVFILVMGVSAAAGLAIYVFSQSNNVVKQIIATGLAREGLEAVKNMRDSNWMTDSLSTNCYDYGTNPIGQMDANCYKSWLSAKFNITPPTSGQASFVLSLDPNSANFWQLTQQGVGVKKYGLNFKTNLADVPLNSFAGFYEPEKVSLDGNSGFYREIILQDDSTAPYNVSSEFHRLRVISRVWWTDKKCPQHSIFANSITSGCKVELETYLTNWRNY